MSQAAAKHLPESACPRCGYVMDDASPIFGPDCWPVPGDVSVCLMCGEFLCFDSELLLHRATNEEINDLGPDDRKWALELSRRIMLEDPLGFWR
jgi:hypothetical protein